VSIIDTLEARASGHRALAFGDYLATDAWAGTVVSAHAPAINILREDGLLVSVVTAERSMTAMSVLVGSAFEHPSGADDAPALLGRPAQWGHGRLLVRGHASISLVQARIWTGSVDPVGRRIPAERLLLLEHAVADCGKPGGLLGVLLPGAAQDHAVQFARKVLAEGRPDRLVGLGPGMTPAGDDFLAGALLAGALGLGAGLQGMDPGRIEAALPGTTPAGRTLLWLALRKSFPSYLRSFVAAVADAPLHEEVAAAVRAACSHGETSGTDAVAGFCFAAHIVPT